jgi:ornithine carbamoyltransferase
VLNSIIEAGSLMGFDVNAATPGGFEPDPGMVATACARGGSIGMHHDPAAALEGADVVVTDTWVSMGDKESAEKIEALTPFQVTPQRMAQANEGAVFLHCLPAHRGEEVVDAVIDGPQSAVWDEAENRLHAQKAILLWCLGKL